MRCGQRPAPRRPRGNASTRTSPRLPPGAIDRVALALALLAEVVVGRVTAVEGGSNRGEAVGLPGTTIASVRRRRYSANMWHHGRCKLEGLEIGRYVIGATGKTDCLVTWRWLSV